MEDDEEMLPEYDLTNAVRGKYAARYALSKNLVMLAPDVARVFSDSQSVNEALRVLIRLNGVGRRLALRNAQHGDGRSRKADYCPPHDEAQTANV